MGTYLHLLDLTIIALAAGSFLLGNLWHGNRARHILAAKEFRRNYQLYLDALAQPDKATI